jgi:Na+-driven multidrug efflux pump
METMPRQVVSLFKPDENLSALAVSGLRWVFLCYPIVGFQMVASTYFQSIGKASKSIVMSMSRQVLILIPLLLILPDHWAVTGVWASITISDLLSVIISVVLLTAEFKNKSIYNGFRNP